MKPHALNLIIPCPSARVSYVRAFHGYPTTGLYILHFPFYNAQTLYMPQLFGSVRLYERWRQDPGASHISYSPDAPLIIQIRLINLGLAISKCPNQIMALCRCL